MKPTKEHIQLRDSDILRIQAVMQGKLDIKWVSIEEIEAFKVLCFEYWFDQLQTHASSATVQ
jgi:hypothetical protein